MKSFKTSIQKGNQALRQLNARPLDQNLENVRVFRAKARRRIRESKRKSWKQYVSRLNSRTSIKKVIAIKTILKTLIKSKKKKTFI